MEITLMFVLVLFTGYSACLPSRNKVYTYFSDKKMSWNQAREICHARGLALVSPLTASDLSTLFEYRESIWKSVWSAGPSDDIWTSLHSPEGDPEGLFWDNCNPLRSGHSVWGSLDAANILDKRCTKTELKASQKWSLYGCERAKSVICENVTAKCAFVSQDIVVDSFTNQKRSCHQDVCVELCRSTIYQEKECWAYSYEDMLNCTLYFAQSREEVIAAQSEGRTVRVEIKTCYSGMWNEDKLGEDLYKALNVPLNTCRVTTVSTQIVSDMSSMITDTGVTTQTISITTPMDIDTTATPEAISTVPPWSTDTTVTADDSSTMSSSDIDSVFTTKTMSTRARVGIDTTVTSDSIITMATRDTDPGVTTQTISNMTPVDINTPVTTEATSTIPFTDTDTPTVTEAMSTMPSSNTYSLAVPSSTSELTEQNSPSTTIMVTSPSIGLLMENETLGTSLPNATGMTTPSRQTRSETSGIPSWVTESSVLTQSDYYSSMLPRSKGCSCPCPPKPNRTMEERQTFMAGILDELTINTSTISSTRRKKTSAVDERVLSLGIGVLGGVFLSLPFVVIAVTDLMSLKSQVNIFG